MPGTIADLLEHSYRTHGSRTAVRDSRGGLTYDELHERARRIAAHLHNAGVRPRDRVALIISNRSEYVQIEQALALGGFVRVAAIVRIHNNEAIHIFDDAKPSFAFIEESWLAKAGKEFLNQLPCPVALVGANEIGRPASFDFLRKFDSFTAPIETYSAWSAPKPGDLAWLMYTSGSTGVPKGVMHTHRSVAAMIHNTLQVMQSLRTEDVAIHTAPLSHFSGTIALAVLAAGGENVLLERFEPKELIDAIRERGVTVLPVVPTQLNMLTDYLHLHHSEIRGLRHVPYAGSAIVPERLAAAKVFFGTALVQYYGSSEVPMPITALLPDDHVDTKNELGLPRFASAGRAIGGVEVSIRDPHNKPLGPGARGEIVVRSPAASSGYWQNAEATNEIQELYGFIHTGDIGVFDNEGFLFIVDRKKDMIITGGFNVFSREVENVIGSMVGVREVAVVSAPDKKWGESIAAVIAPTPGTMLTLEQVQAHCRKHLAGYKVPRHLVLMEILPKSSTGKLQKRALREQFWGKVQRKVGG